MGGLRDERAFQHRRKRYEIELPLRFWVRRAKGLTVQGIGKTCNLSSGGVLFETDRPVVPGELVKLAVEWPALLDGVHQMILILEGRIIRSEFRGSALRIAVTEFRIRGRQAREDS